MPMTHHAFAITFDAPGPVGMYVTVARDLAEAAQKAVSNARGGAGSGDAIHSIRWLAPALGFGETGSNTNVSRSTSPISRSTPSQVQAPAKVMRPLEQPEVPAQPPQAPSTPPAVHFTGTRAEQLVQLLRLHPQPMHVRDIGAKLNIDIVAVQNSVAGAARKGWVQRLGRRSGMVALVDMSAEVKLQEKPPPKQAQSDKLTRLEQAIEVLRAHGGEAHTDVITAEVGVSLAHMRNTLAAGVKRGLLRRVGDRTARVALVTAMPSAQPDPEAVDPSLVAKLSGMQKRTYKALIGLGGQGTAKDVAGVIGCRPREAGNALAQLVDAKLVLRVSGEGKPRYSAAT